MSRKSLKKCHFIGIGGIGMSGLARLLQKQNALISGSDRVTNEVINELNLAGAKITEGHNAGNIDSEMTVVYSSDIPDENVEILEAKRLGCELIHRSELLKRLIAARKGLAVAGTHGKTTTSALLTATLKQANKDPSYMVGGILTQFGLNADHGKGEYFIAEADESDGTFLQYDPFGAIITNIDLDHLNYFGSEENLIESFKKFASQIASDDHLFWCGDDKRLKELKLAGFSYGFSESCSLKLSHYVQRGWTSFFDIDFKGRTYHQIEFAMPGKHNALNAAAVFGLSLSVGANEEMIREAFKNFKGVKRRSEQIGEEMGVLFLDDYAHHPTEIAATLKAVRKAIGERRLIAIYQPHRYSRLKHCLGRYGSCFQDADEVWITDIYTAGEPPVEGVTKAAIESELRGTAVSKKQLEERDFRPHDVIVTLGAGDITHFGRRMIEALKKRPPKKICVGVVKGGASYEHEISLKSACYVEQSLSRDLYDVKVFTIDRDGRWSFDAKELKKCDVMFPVLHGPYGEDGTIQGLFEMLGLPYVGCSHRACAIAMDKSITKKLAILSGIRTLPFIPIHVRDWRVSKENLLNRIKSELTFPVFVKGSHLGSSYGVIKVEEKEFLERAIESVLKLDSELIVEQGISAREIEFAVLGNDEIHVFPPGEILTEGKVYDLNAKYSQHSLPITTRPNLPDELIDAGRDLAKKAFQAIGGEGMARVDFFLDGKGNYWLNEINPIPGLTEKSLYPKICQTHGIEGKELVNRLVILGLHRTRQSQAVRNA